jgi:iron(III) transport system substrate-binding protein
LVRGAEHPATSLLFIEWLVTDGQKVLTEFFLDPARSDLATAPGAEEIFVDVESYLAEQEEWTERYEQLVTLGKLIE